MVKKGREPIVVRMLLAGLVGMVPQSWLLADSSWQRVHPLAGITVIRADPHQAGRLIAVGSEGVRVPDSQRWWSYVAFFTSLDGGSTWTTTRVQSASDEVSSFVIDPADSRIMYLGLRSGGMRKSTDGGVTWQTVDLSGTGYPVGIVDIALDASHPGLIYATGTFRHLSKSEDGGTTWHSLASEPANCWCQVVAVANTQPATVYLGGRSLFKSQDAGVTWEEVPAPSVSVGLLTLDPADPQHLYVGRLSSSGTAGERALWESDDGGASWQKIWEPVLDKDYVTALALDPAHPFTLYIASAVGGIHDSEDAGATWVPLDEAGEVTHVRALLRTDDALLAGSYTDVRYNGIWRLPLPSR